MFDVMCNFKSFIRMLLRRLGNKKMVVKATNILDYFPKHDLFIDMFFGAGGLFFSKPKSKYNICNDRDSDVFNLFNVISNHKNELEEAFYNMPVHEDLFNFWRKNKETEPIKRAIRFLMLSNFGFLGKSEILRFELGKTKSILLENIDKTSKFIFDVQFMNADFRDVIPKIHFRHKERNRVFIYADPPYLGTANNYADDCQFTQKDTEDLFETLVNSGIKFAISEFDNPIILNLAKNYNLNVINLGERKNLGNRRNEILVCNYQTSNLFNHGLF